MKDLLRSWDRFAQQWGGRNIILFLDYDGTLAPIAQSPQEAVLPKENKDLLRSLAKAPGCQVVVISGRALADVKAMVGIQEIDYIGNHGWEIEGPHIRFETLLAPQVTAALEQIKYELEAKLSTIEGAFVEDKGTTLSVHYRLVAPQKVFLVKRIFNKASLPFRRQNKIKTGSGKKVLEIRPFLEWDKGKAALWFLRRQELICGEGNVLPVYVGDDATDEEAFRALKAKGIAVLVGRGQKSHAQYYLESPEAVTEFLKCHLLQAVRPCATAGAKGAA